MPVTANDLIYGFLVPAIAALLAMVLLRRLLPSEAARRYAPSLGLLLGFQLGYWLLKLGEVATSPHYQWLPFTFGAVGLVSVFLESNGANLVDRLLSYGLITVIAGWFLIPTYDSLPLSWRDSLIAWTALIVVSSLLSRPLISKFPGPMLPAVYCTMAICAAGTLVLAGSLSRGQISGVVGGASFGLLLSTIFDKKSRQLDGVAFPVQFFFCSIMMIGQTNSYSDIPTPAYYILPLAPLGLWFGSFGPLKTMKGKSGAIARFSIPAIICLASLGWPLYCEFRMVDGGY